MILRLLGWLFILIFVLFFTVFNFEPKVVVILFPGVYLENVPLAVVIIISFVLGLLAGLIITLVQVLKYRLQLEKLLRERQDLSQPLS